MSLALAVIIFVFEKRVHLAEAQHPASLASSAATTTKAAVLNWLLQQRRAGP
jgi:hypothetical protein